MEFKDIEKKSVKELLEYASILERKSLGLSERDKLEGYYTISVAISKKTIQDILAQMKMSQKELAKKTGLSTSSISAYKTGVAIPSMSAMWMIILILLANKDLKDFDFLPV